MKNAAALSLPLLLSLASCGQSVSSALMPDELHSWGYYSQGESEGTIVRPGGALGRGYATGGEAMSWGGGVGLTWKIGADARAGARGVEVGEANGGRLDRMAGLLERAVRELELGRSPRVREPHEPQAAKVALAQAGRGAQSLPASFLLPTPIGMAFVGLEPRQRPEIAGEKARGVSNAGHAGHASDHSGDDDAFAGLGEFADLARGLAALGTVAVILLAAARRGRARSLAGSEGAPVDEAADEGSATEDLLSALDDHASD